MGFVGGKMKLFWKELHFGSFMKFELASGFKTKQEAIDYALSDRSVVEIPSYKNESLFAQNYKSRWVGDKT